MKDSRYSETCKSDEGTTDKNPNCSVTDSKEYYRKIFWDVIFNENMKREMSTTVDGEI